MHPGTLIRLWLPAFAWMLVIFLASTDLMSAQHTSRIIGRLLRWLNPDVAPATIAAVQLVVRKAAHLTEYAILAVLLARATRGSPPRWGWRYAALALLVAGAYAALDEFHQGFVVSRTASIGDVMIDTAGALIGILGYHVSVRRRSAAHIETAAPAG